MKRYILLYIVLFIISTGLTSQTKLKSIDDISKFGVENSINYRKSILSLSEAEDKREGILKLDSSSIATKTSYSGTSTDSIDLETTILIPVIDQLTITGSVSENIEGKVGLSISPLSHSETRIQNDLSYRSSVINSQSALLSAEIDAVESSLNWMSASKNFNMQNENWLLEEIIYNDDKSRYNSGDITLDELKESLISWSEARKLYISSEQNLKETEKNLYEDLGSTSKDVEVKIISVKDLEESLVKLKSSMNTGITNFNKNSSLQLSAISVKSAKEHLKKTWTYEPDITAQLAVPYDENGLNSDGFSASINFSLSLDDFNKSERDRAEDYYNISILENRLKINEAEVDLNRTLNMLESNNINSDIFRVEYEQAEILLSEAELLYSSGVYSEVELEQSKVYLTQGENNLFDALVTEYLSWLDLKRYL